MDVANNYSRTHSRMLAVMGIYSYRINGGAPEDLIEYLQEQDIYEFSDKRHLENLIHGVISNIDELLAKVEPCLDRKYKLISLVELSILLASMYEMSFCAYIPYKVSLNEYISISKEYCSAGSYKYINTVLDKYVIRYLLSE